MQARARAHHRGWPHPNRSLVYSLMPHVEITDLLLEIRDRSYENQRFRASGLNLLVAAITLWNTAYLSRVVEALSKVEAVSEKLLRHVGPLGWEHIAFTGDYSWRVDRRVARGGFRPIRRHSR